jgi:ribonucleoside-diphosphate reductase alpha chain
MNELSTIDYASEDMADCFEPLSYVRPCETVCGVVVDRSRDRLLTDFGKSMMAADYLLPGESYQDRFARVAAAYSDDTAHAQRLYDYISRLWFMPATPVLSNGGTTRGLPISCFLNECEDSLKSISDLWRENIELASKGGGIGSYWGNLRSIAEKTGLNGKTSGIMPFIKVQDSLTLAISQGSLRRGSGAGYLPINHPEIEEFVEMRRVTGGDLNRKSLNLHHGVVVSDAFMNAVENDDDWDLVSPKDGKVVRTLRARELWIRILLARIETGEPYILFVDTVNRAIPEHHRLAGLFVKTSNLCIEIMLATGRDHHKRMRTAVCCLSSLNLELFETWSGHPRFIEDVLRFLDNVLADFIARAPSERRRVEADVLAPLLADLKKTLGDTVAYASTKAALEGSIMDNFSGMMDNAIYAASRERSVGLGVMGFHSFLQSKGIPFEGAVARMWNKRIFSEIKTKADATNVVLAKERGACPDAAEFGFDLRFSNMTAIAPTASISVICGQSSPGIDPMVTNAYTEKRKTGSYQVRNKHLAMVLEAHGRNDEATWSDIMINEGSVQHLDFLTKKEKAVFKAAPELDQLWVIEHAADRTPFIDQSQSLNIYLPANCSKKTLHDVHWAAWKKGVKSLYYCRSLAIHRAQKVSSGLGAIVTSASVAMGTALKQPEPEVCEACQ